MDYLENEVKNNPYHLKSWLNYLSFLDGSNEYERYKIYERGLFYLPRSYKLWYAYLDERERSLRAYSINDKGYDCLIETFERSLTHLHKMPKLWEKYCKLLIKLCRGTNTRRTFDRALQALPITQHQGIWDLYIQWIAEFNCPDTSIRVYRRYLMFDPTQREIFINYLHDINMYQEEVKQLILCLDDPHYISPIGSTKHQLWMKLCDICAHHGDEIANILDVENIIKCGINQFSDEVGRLWSKLADFYIQQGLFNKARDIYEEALNQVVTVKDFTIVFDKYIKVEENILTAKLQWLEELQTQITDEQQQQQQNKKINSNKKTTKVTSSVTHTTTATTTQPSSTLSSLEIEKIELENEIELRLSRIEYMLAKRPLLLNSVVLRQNPHNVYEWLKRIKILKQQYKAAISTTTTTTTTTTTVTTKSDEHEIDMENRILKELIAQTYADAIKTINPSLAIGKFSHIYIGFANYFQKQNDYDSARSIYEKAIIINFKSVEELANVWCAYAELEMKLDKYEEALSILQRAVTKPSANTLSKYKNIIKNKMDNDNDMNEDSTNTAAASAHVTSLANVYKNVKIWNLYLDLEENIGTVDTCRSAYERAIELKIATPQMMLNYASYFEEKHYYDDSFTVYEKAITLFVYPQLRIIWLTYIDKFVDRYGGSKMERLRDMFENCLKNLPEEYSAEFYIKYGKIEEEMGLARHAISVYDRASRVVAVKERLNMYRLYIKKMEQFYGITKTRVVYERAVAELVDDDCREICVDFAEMETKLGEIDRARALYQYGSQFAPPAAEPKYWAKWKEFEEAHGNEDTYREMLRVKRSVEAFNSQVPSYVGAKRPAEDSGASIAFQPEHKRQAATVM